MKKEQLKVTAGKVLPAVAVFGLTGVAVYVATRAFRKAGDELKDAIDTAFDKWNDYR